MGRVVLVTGAARASAGAFIRSLQDSEVVERIVAVDLRQPVHPLGAAEFVRLDIRQPSIAGVLAEHGVDTVVHLDLQGTPSPLGRSRTAVKETNVIGTMQLLGACQKAPALRRLVVKSTTGVYGSAPRDPALFDETMRSRALPRGGFAKDAVEAEGYVRGFARRRPDVAVSVLRFAHELGSARESPLAGYFSLPVLPTVLGHDPRLQFVDEEDVLGALHRVLEPDGPAGTFNVAGDGVLLLSQCARRLGRPTVPLPLPALGWSAAALRAAGAPDLPAELVDVLTHGGAVATGHAREVLGFTARRSTAEVLAAFLRRRGSGPVPPQRLAGAVDLFAGLLPGRKEG